MDNFMKRGLSSYNFWMPCMNAKVTYFVGSFSLSAYYQSGIKRSGVGSVINKYPCLYSFWVNYSVGDLKLQLMLPNIFTTKNKAGTSVYHSQAYSFKSANYSNEIHQYVQLSATWSFGYGKRMDRRDEVQAITGGESIILK